MERQITQQQFVTLPAGSAWTTGCTSQGNRRYWTRLDRQMVDHYSAHSR